MTFRICPYNLKIARLFQNMCELKPRMPLDRRAEQARLSRGISSYNSKEQLYRPRSELGGNIIQQFRRFGFDEEALAVASLSHIGSIFRKMQVAFWYGMDQAGYPNIVVKASRQPVKFTPDPFNLKLRDQEDLRFYFFFMPCRNLIRASGLVSRPGGLGGPILVALYNVAKDIAARQITYSVVDNNIKAMQIYFHLDFGRPTDFTLTDWVVEVI